MGTQPHFELDKYLDIFLESQTAFSKPIPLTHVLHIVHGPRGLKTSFQVFAVQEDLKERKTLGVIFVPK